MIKIADLTYSYTQKHIISFPSFSVSKEEHCLLLGESGSGKTTLLHLMGGLLRGYSGNIKLNNTELSSMTEVELDKFRGRNIGFIFQKNHLISALTVEDNLRVAPYLAGIPVDTSHMQKVLSDLAIAEKSKNLVSEISQGQAQRVAIARAVINRPPIILADEPTSALDDKNCERVITLLLAVAEQNKATLIIATHDHRLRSIIRKQIQL